MGAPRQWPERYRERALELRAQGRSYAQIGRQLGIHKQTVRFWFLDKRQVRAHKRSSLNYKKDGRE